MDTFLLLSFLSVLLVAGCTQQQAITTTTTGPATPTTTSAGAKEVIVEITSAGFSPNPITINKGDTVAWLNLDTEDHWPASATHPTHIVYPGSGIQKCGTAEQANIFDACKGLSQGEIYSFVFNEVGEWNYHDHLNPSRFGKVIVQG